MTSDGPSDQPKKRSRKRLILVLACVVTVTTITLLAIPPKKEVVRVWFVYETNTVGHERILFPAQILIPNYSTQSLDSKQLVLEGTNGLPRKIQFAALVFTGATHQATTPIRVRPYYDYTSADWSAGATFHFTLEAPAKDVPYFVAWYFYDNTRPATRWLRFRWRCYEFFDTHSMPSLAYRFGTPLKLHYIPSTEIKE